MEDFAIDILKTYGLAGLVIFAQAWFINKLYTRNQELHESLNDMGRESVKANETNAHSLNQMSEALRATGGTLHQLSQMVQQLLYRSTGGQQ